MPKTTLVLDPKLPPMSWETRRGTGSKIKRSRTSLSADLFLAVLEDPKAEKLAVGEQVHAELVRIMGRSGVRTAAQMEAEKRAGLRRRAPERPNPFGPPSRKRGPNGRIHVDRSTFGGFEPEPPGTMGPGGVAS